VTLLGALSYGELAAMFPKAGGNYVYLREGISPLFGYLYGWTLFVVIQTGTIAAVAVAFRAFHIGALSRPHTRRLPGHDAALSGANRGHRGRPIGGSASLPIASIVAAHVDQRTRRADAAVHPDYADRDQDPPRWRV